MSLERATMSRLERYEAWSSPALTALALAFIVVYAVPILWPGSPGPLRAACTASNVAIWLIFVADLVVRVWLTDRRWRWLATHPVDVVIVLLPMLRPLRVLRVFSAGQTLFSRGARLPLARTLQAVAAAAAVLIFISALAILDAERGKAGANIGSFDDALWWAGATVTTVGYGDRFPVTGTGRLVAFGLMLVGISLLGIITASVAAWFVSRTTEVSVSDTESLDARLGRVEAQLTEITRLLEGQPAVEKRRR